MGTEKGFSRSMIKQGHQSDIFKYIKGQKISRFPFVLDEDPPQVLYSQTEWHCIVGRQEHAGISITLAGLFAEKIGYVSRSQHAKLSMIPSMPSLQYGFRPRSICKGPWVGRFPSLQRSCWLHVARSLRRLRSSGQLSEIGDCPRRRIVSRRGSVGGNPGLRIISHRDGGD